MQTFKIYTLGCKANQYDSQVIREKFERAGFKELENGSKANFCVINTCTVTSSADRQSRYLIRRAKRDDPSAKIVVTGCYAHANAQEIKMIKGVDLILDNQDKQRILKFISVRRRAKPSQPFLISEFRGHNRAFVKVQDGCDNFCSFCKVPYVRGRSKSRNLKEIIDEVKRLAANGYKEIVLTGICLGDFGKDLPGKIDLADLIGGIEELDGISRIRLSSIEAKDVTAKLIKKMKTSRKLCPHLHIPFQSGDNKILKLMNRRDSRQSYLKLVHKLKRNIKDIAIATDIMVGFPGEGRKEFLNTLDFLRKAGPLRTHIFPFQARDLTPLFNVKDTIAASELQYRFNAVKDLTQDLALRFKRRFLNRNLEVLFEDKKDGFWRGYSRNYLLTYIKDSDNLILSNRVLSVRIKEIKGDALYARRKEDAKGFD